MATETPEDLTAECLERWELDGGVWDDPCCAMRVDPAGEFVEFEAAKGVIDALRDKSDALTARALAAEASLASSDAQYQDLYRIRTAEQVAAGKLGEAYTAAQKRAQDRDALIEVLRWIADMVPHHAGQTVNEFHMQKRARELLAAAQKEAEA